MADPSRSEIIKTKPIGRGLNAFRDSFNSTCKGLDISGSFDALDRIGDEGLQNLVLDLILALQGLPASRLLPSKSGNRNLFGDLSTLNSAVNTNNLDLEPIIPLLNAVLHNDPDELVWDKVYEAVTKTTALTVIASPTTPPQSGPPIAVSIQLTPWAFNTGSFADTSDLRRNVDPILKIEVEDNLRIDHPDFFNTFFGHVSRLSDMAAAVFENCKDAEPPLYQEGVGWLNWPEGCKEATVLQFLQHHVVQFSLFADERGFHPSKRRPCVATPNKPIPGSVSKRKLDLGFAYVFDDENEDGNVISYDWSHILVLGELKSNPREDHFSSTWLDLLRYAREVFGAQDTRRFVLGFTLCGSIMRLWEFDRLGGVASMSFDINKDGQMFVSVILGYLWMNEEELGFDPTIVGDVERYIHIQRNHQMEQLSVGELIKRQRSVAGRATTCWKSSLKGGDSEGRFAIKDSWEFEERPEEGILLKEATEGGVHNVARYYHHEIVRIGGAIDNINHNIRKGLSDDIGKNPFQPRRPPAGRDAVTSQTTSSGSGLWRGRSRHRAVTRKRSSSCVQISMPPPKRSCSDSPVKQDAQQRRDRVHRRLIMRDVGKSIYQASSSQAILIGLLGGIKGHESLLNAKILHRDISIGNVMLNEAEDDGFLIDLDLAVKIDREKASGAPSKTGTKVFMAIGALYGEGHSFMHDLESFFWVLFWLCAHWNGTGQQRSKTDYESWNYEQTKKLAREKAGLVDEEDKFDKEISENFTSYCKTLIPCVQDLRRVVFPGGKRWLTENRQLYSQMKSVLERAKKNLGSN